MCIMYSGIEKASQSPDSGCLKSWLKKGVGRGREGMEENEKEGERINPGELEATQFQIAM